MTRESRITADREMVSDWAEEHDAVPVRDAGTTRESGRLHVVPRSRVEESHEEVTWDEFYEAMERDDQVVLYHGEDADESFEVVDRADAVGRTSLVDEEVEEQLLAGETVVSEITETTVVERTVVEEATVESEVVDRGIVREEVVDAELLTREVVDCEVTDVGDVDTAGPYESAQFETGYRSDDELSVAVEVDENWSVTREVLERLTIESRVTETDAHETDTVEGEHVESTIDLAGVQRALLESGLLASDAETYEDVETRSIESEFREGNVVETRLIERRTVDDEVRLRREYSGEITAGETVAADTVHSEVVESELVEREDLEAEGVAYDSLWGTGAAGAAMDEDATAAGIEPGTGEEIRVSPTADDEGKHVIDAAGDDVGMVVEVAADTLYVDPHPSLTERIKAALDWGDLDEDDAYPIDASRVSRITKDHVELAVEERDESR